MNSAVLCNCIKRSAEAGNSKAVGRYQAIDYRTRVLDACEASPGIPSTWFVTECQNALTIAV